MASQQCAVEGGVGAFIGTTDSTGGMRQEMVITTPAGVAPVAGSAATNAVFDGGPNWVPVQTSTNSSDMTTAATVSVVPTTGLKLVADDIVISSDTAMNFILQEETSNTQLLKVFIPVNGAYHFKLRDCLRVPTVNKRLFGKASATGNVSVFVSQHSE